MKSRRWKKAFLLLLDFTVIIVVAMIGTLNQPQFGQLPKGERLERIKQSPNYKDGEFKNLSETPVFTSDKNGFMTMLDYTFSKKVNLAPKDSLKLDKTDIKSIDPNEDVLIWFGHSSYYIQLKGKTFLVDPVFSGYAAPFSFTMKAFKGTNLYFTKDLPEIDYLIISHDHYDHLDHQTILKLKDKVKQVVCGLGVGQHFEFWGYDNSMITELDWYDGIELGDEMSLTATPARHFSGRGLKRNQSLWASYVLQAEGYSMFIGGDGGHDPFFKELGEKYGPFDIAILEQGQYNKRWQAIHLHPSQVFEAAEQLAASRIFPVHNSKFALAAHPWNEPLNMISEQEASLPLMTPKIGEIVYLNDSTQSFEEWWREWE
jgi:L-ascorbate metabolism protein UlaG (beta-lactamase superfamily)